MATRWGGAGAALEIPGPSRPAAPANFSRSSGPAGGGKMHRTKPLGSVACGAPRAGVPCSFPTGESWSHRAWGLWGPRSHLTLLPNPYAHALQVVRMGTRMPPSLATHTHTRGGGHSLIWAPEQSSDSSLIPRARVPGPGAGEGGSWARPGPRSHPGVLCPAGPSPRPLSVLTWGPAEPGQALC